MNRIISSFLPIILLVMQTALAAPQPNVLFISLDDMNDWLGCYGGHPDAITPNIDRLAARGVRFTNAHCVSPICGPSRASVLTGMRPETTGVYHNKGTYIDYVPDAVTFPEHFRANGYRTLAAGKVNHNLGAPDPRLWDENGPDCGILGTPFIDDELHTVAMNPIRTNNGGLRGRKGTVWEGGLRVPFCMRFPRELEARTHCGTPVNTLDVGYTFCQQAGFDNRALEELSLDGKNLLSIAGGTLPSRSLFWRRGNTSAIRAGDWKLITLKDRAAFLFDVRTDSEETVNLIASNPDQTERLQLALEEWDQSLPEPLWRKKASDSYDQFLLKYWDEEAGPKLTAASDSAAKPPYVVAVPLADAGRGLVRMSETEIRAYPGKGGTHFLQSKDNGLTWAQVALPTSYPDATCMAKEAPSLARYPDSGEFLRVEPKYSARNEMDGLYISSGGLDGTWRLVLGEDGKGLKPAGILRTPVWVNGGKRIVIPAHGGGCWTWYSDDQGESWSRSNKVNSPHHETGGIHKGTRWNHGMVEGTIVELNDDRLWMVARTAQDQHYETFSEDFGETWSEARPSRFHGTITMPTFFRMEDGRLLFLWSNTTSLPEVERLKKRGGEDVFTNRDALHAAISEDDGKTWIGFREVVLDEHRNDADYAVTPGSNDRGKHQSEVVQLDEDRVLLSCGQHPLHRKLMIMDVRWLYETERSSDFSNDGIGDWSTHQYINQIVGHCGYNRTPGATIDSGALRIRRVDDRALTNPSQGAMWNFPAGKSGSVVFSIRLESNEAKAQICLTDRWFNPTDETVPIFAQYVVELDRNLLIPGQTHSVEIHWTKGSDAIMKLDGKSTNITLPPKQDTCQNGISYIHIYNPATTLDEKGFTLFSAKATIQ